MRNNAERLEVIAGLERAAAERLAALESLHAKETLRLELEQANDALARSEAERVRFAAETGEEHVERGEPAVLSS